MANVSINQDYFNVWSVDREDVARAHIDEDDNEPEWPYELTDDGMRAIAERMRRYLEYDMDSYWESIRDAAKAVVEEEV